MSPVFRHGRLRLYLLKLLDEAPRHGYEVIRLLQDRFMGVYAPSPGTIYPRLARLGRAGGTVARTTRETCSASAGGGGARATRGIAGVSMVPPARRVSPPAI